MLKRILLVLILIFSFIVPSYSSPSMTLEEEAQLINYISNGINEYMSTVDWYKNKSYEPELTHIQSMVTKYGWKKEECYVGMLGAELEEGQPPVPFAVAIIIKGKADPNVKPFWKILIYLPPPKQKNPQEHKKVVPNNRNRFGI